MSTTAAPITVDEFLKLPDIEEQRIELIDGEVVDTPGGGPAHELVKSNLIEMLAVWCFQQRAGKVFVESAYRLHERTMLVPDLSVLNIERTRRGNELLRGAPDLAIEVVSSETADRLQTKIRLYFKHGSKDVWSVFPGSRIVQVNHPNGRTDTFEQDQILEDPDALPAFSTPVSAIFEGL
ncbi:MAG: Uma2 family endonuclease [Bryobacteraceae bacterium]|jgi:Uma2 family endonuclease